MFSVRYSQDRQMRGLSGELLRLCIRSEDQTAQNLVTANSFVPEKASPSNNEAGQRAETAWSNGKSAISASKRADLNGGFRAPSQYNGPVVAFKSPRAQSR